MKRLKKEGVRYVIGVLFVVCLLFLGFNQQFKQFIEIPTSMVLFEGSEEVIEASGFVIDDSSHVQMDQVESQTIFQGIKTGKTNVTVQHGNWPTKKIDVSVLPEIKVVPGGQSIGVKLNTEGVLVVGHHKIDTKAGQKSPGEFAGIEVGDMITDINGEKMHTMSEVSRLVQLAGEENEDLKVKVLRGEKEITTVLTPEKAKGDHLYRLGLYIRDSAAGVGTMTFYDPESKRYGALGHVISDIDTKKPVSVLNGQLLRSSVTSISRGMNGEPGEKLASISKDREILGTINKNSSLGIYGTLNDKIELKNKTFDQPMPISTSAEVKKGPAKILTVVDGEEVEQFDIEIVSNTPQDRPATKGMVIKVTDERLLDKTGGIVQGMSGSPIIQGDKIVGAVTHVFVNDPTSGYGCHISWMLEESGIHTGLIKHQAKAS
ncbi:MULTISPECIES: SpoIVB peptidase [unclassified Shouchella]|uniref:SpoIVB peptidase n=1 Tax=unclassified Shouchella TaxID=2893065 RepID=UPI0039A03A1F